VRGDSLRDLYAKTLALLGLGMLAGTAALVDSWPTRAGLSRSADRSHHPAALAPVLLDVVSEAPTAPAPSPTVTVRSPGPVRTPKTAGVQEPLHAEFAGAAPLVISTEIPDRFLASTLSLGPPVEPMGTASSRPALEAPAVAPRVALVDSFEIDEADATGDPDILTALADGRKEPGDGLITGAFKRTGSSIVKTGARTGASIFDAVRVVSGAMRRAIPTN
jgi:hypothetical protein